jgi:hypothetical protein
MVASDAFNIDAEDQGKVLSWKFYYKAQTNPANANWSGTSSNSFGVAIYDVTNSTWLGVAGQFSMTQSSGIGISTGTFQTATTTAQLRIVVYNVNATSGAVTVYFDDFSVGPQTSPIGAIVTDWESFTPTFTGFGTPTNVRFFSRRVGDKLEVVGNLTTGTTTAVLASITLPSGRVLDTNKLGIAANTTAAAGTRVGWAGMNSGGGNAYYSMLTAPGTSTSLVYIGPAAGSSTQFVPANGSGFNSGVTVYIEFCVPIAGWSSTVQMSNDTDTRVIAMAAYAAPTGTPQASATILNFGAANLDTHAGWNGTTTYTVPVSGVYEVSVEAANTGTAATGKGCQLELRKNGSSVFALSAPQSDASSSRTWAQATGLVSCVAGDTLSAYYFTSFASPVFQAGVGNISIKRLSGPSVIAATESINARYTTAAGQSIANGLVSGTAATVNFGTKVFDSHNAVTVGAGWVFTAPVSGKYLVAANLCYTSASWTAGTGAVRLMLNKNGTDYSRLDHRAGAAFTGEFGIGGSDFVDLLAGDTVAIKTFHGEGTSRSLEPQAILNHVSIMRIGN